MSYRGVNQLFTGPPPLPPLSPHSLLTLPPPPHTLPSPHWCIPLVCIQDSTVDIDQPLFQPFPSHIVFQKYEPHQQYKVPLVLRNADKVSQVYVGMCACMWE